MKKELNLVWNVYDFHINSKECRVFNIFDHYSFRADVEKLLKTKMTKDEFAEKLRREVQYRYWAKSEWECVVSGTSPHIGKRELERIISECYLKLGKDVPTPRCTHANLDDAEKIDVYDQVRLNWDYFVDYVWGHSKYCTDVV